MNEMDELRKMSSKALADMLAECRKVMDDETASMESQVMAALMLSNIKLVLAERN